MEAQPGLTSCQCWEQSVKYTSLPDQSCKVRWRDSSVHVSLPERFIFEELCFIVAGPQCVPRRIYSITTGGSDSQLSVAVEGTDPVQQLMRTAS